MLVVIIIGILAAMALPRLTGQSEEARIATAKAEVNSTIVLALDMFELHNSRFPTTEEGLAALRSNPGNLASWKGPYLKKDPVDPWGRSYAYRSPGEHNNDYDVYSKGPDGTEGNADDIGNW